MEITEIIKALRRNMVETGSLICIGCGREHNCSTHGCAIMREAADALEKLFTEKQDMDAHLKAINDSLSAQLRRATPESKPLTITFPCQIGDTVWMVGTVSRRDTEYTPYEYVLAVSTGFVREYGIYTGHWGAVVETKGGSFCYPLSEFDKSIFTDKTAAEQALAVSKPEGSAT